jgi:hypothetical protein
LSKVFVSFSLLSLLGRRDSMASGRAKCKLTEIVSLYDAFWQCANEHRPYVGGVAQVRRNGLAAGVGTLSGKQKTKSMLSTFFRSEA